MFEAFDIKVVDKTVDGILAVQFTHKETERDFVVFSCYLPPENSTRGRDASSFFAHLLSQVYLHSECDSLYITGVFNARIGTLSDILDECDFIRGRQVIDRRVNQHGHDFLEFLNDAKFCVLNGRVNPQDDSFTSISRRGNP